MIFWILAVTIPGFSLGIALTALANRCAPSEERRRRWFKLLTFIAVVHLVLIAVQLGRPWLLVGAAIVLIVGFWELTNALSAEGERWSVTPYLLMGSYIGLGLALLYSLSRLSPMIVAFIYLVVAAFDGFSQAVGQFVGRRKLAPSLSPAKTIEGALGGAAGAVAVAVPTHSLIGTTSALAAVVGLSIAACALAGDLASCRHQGLQHSHSRPWRRP
jgi:phosphatidate cytidylyltransferase